MLFCTVQSVPYVWRKSGAAMIQSYFIDTDIYFATGALSIFKIILYSVSRPAVPDIGRRVHPSHFGVRCGDVYRKWQSSPRRDLPNIVRHPRELRCSNVIKADIVPDSSDPTAL